jgi:hypothetical protein
VLDSRPVARNSSDPVTGEGLLNINLQRPPGTYSLLFEVMGLNAELNTNMTVTVAACGPGETFVEGMRKYMPCTLKRIARGDIVACCQHSGSDHGDSGSKIC